MATAQTRVLRADKWQKEFLISDSPSEQILAMSVDDKVG
jgi:hypothetical protein